MTGFRIEIDLLALVHKAWDELPWHMRLLGLIPGERARIEAAAVRKMTGETHA